MIVQITKIITIILWRRTISNDITNLFVNTGIYKRKLVQNKKFHIQDTCETADIQSLLSLIFKVKYLENISFKFRLRYDNIFKKII